MICKNLLNKQYLISFPKDENIKELIKKHKGPNEDSFKEFAKLQITINNNSKEINKDNIFISAKDWIEFEEKVELLSLSNSPASVSSKLLENEKNIIKEEEPCIVFLFSGQGAQFNPLIFELYNSEPIFKETMDKIDEIMKIHLGFSTIEKVRQYKDEFDPELNTNQMITQSILLISQISIYKLFTEHWGLKPTIVFGHSFGEIVASYASGMIQDLETLCYVIYNRGKSQQKTFGTGKGMIWVDLGNEEFQEKFCTKFKSVEVCCILSPSNVTIGGDKVELEQIVEQCKLESINTKVLSIPTAFHHSCQDCLYDDMMKLQFESYPPKADIHHISTVKGTLFNKDFYINKEYVFENLRDQARLALGIKNVFQHIENSNLGRNVCFIEIGSRQSLLNYIIKQTPPLSKSDSDDNYFKSVKTFASLTRDKGNEGIHETLVQCFKQGYKNLNFLNQLN
ncbi:hypothetical protein ACTFIR_011091 [Dictyostelium discoideum]